MTCSKLPTLKVLIIFLMRECLAESRLLHKYPDEAQYWTNLAEGIRHRRIKISISNKILLDAFAAICRDLNIFNDDYLFYLNEFFNLKTCNRCRWKATRDFHPGFLPDEVAKECFSQVTAMNDEEDSFLERNCPKWESCKTEQSP